MSELVSEGITGPSYREASLLKIWVRTYNLTRLFGKISKFVFKVDDKRLRLKLELCKSVYCETYLDIS